MTNGEVSVKSVTTDIIFNFKREIFPMAGN